MKRNDYCIENDMARQQENEAMRHSKKVNNSVALIIAFESVNAHIENVLANRTSWNVGVGGQTVGNELYRVLVSGNSIGDLHQSLQLLKEAINSTINGIA